MRVVREYERAVVFRLGRLLPVKGPGLVVLIPLVDRMVRVDLRTVTLTVPPQEVITRDNVPPASRPSATSASSTRRPPSPQIEAFAPGDLADRADDAALRARAAPTSTSCSPSASA